MWFWGAQSPTPVNNNFTIGSRGKVLAADGDYGRSKLSQTLSGLDTTRTYTLSFEYAGAQQFGYNRPTKQWWSVTAGESSWVTPTMSVADRGFNGWNTFTDTFTPSAATIELAFASFGTAGNGTSGAALSPFLLLDNVQVLDSGTPPPPAASVPGPLPIFGAGIAFGWARRLRSRLAATTR